MSQALLVKFQRILVSGSPREYVDLTTSEKSLYEEWRTHLFA